MVTVRKERPAEAATRDALLDLTYGPARFTKTSQRLREGRRPELALVAAGLPWVAFAAGLLVGSVLYLGRLRYGRWPSQVWDVVGALVGSAVGVWYSLRGATFQVWTPAQSVRE